MRFIYAFVIIILIGCSPVLAQEEAPPAQVIITKISQQEVSENRSFIGLLYYDRVSRISTEVSGLVESITVREGDLTKKGSPIVTLNTEILDTDIA
ncbi:MAG: biotin/lipoyl-binding protein, partial [Desulfobulbaceae bacterium]|nr:biotin/lipoyl-binding protein [Desulfobulbaceae bacterium]